MLFAFILHGQEEDMKDLLIEINPFGVNKYPKSFRVKYNSAVKIKINNINPFLGKGSVDIVTSNTDFNNLKNAINTLKKSEEILAEMVKQDSTSTSPTKEPINPDFLIYYSAFFKAYSNINNLVSKKEELDKYVHSVLLIKDIEIFKTQVENIASSINEIERYYQELESKYILLSRANDETKKHYSKEWMDVQLRRELLYSEGFIKSINEIIKYLEQQSFIAYHSDYFYLDNARQIRDDKVVITPKIYDKTGKNVLYTFPDFTITPTHKLRVNFSAGYLLSFMGNEEYGIRYENDEGKGVSKLDENKFSHALGLLTHAFYDFGSSLDYGLSTGLSLNNDAKINFYGGLSVAFTQENRMVLTTGISFVSVKLLDPSNLDDNSNFTSSNIEIKYIERYKSAFFIGFTYNLKK